MFFAGFERLNQHVFAFLAIGGLEHGRHGGFGVVAVVLLVLRRELPRLVGGNDHRPTIHANVGKSEERICSNVESDVLHGCQRASASNGGANH